LTTSVTLAPLTEIPSQSLDPEASEPSPDQEPDQAPIPDEERTGEPDPDPVHAEAGAENQSQDEEDLEAVEDADADEEMSLVGSLYLHLLSEHDCYDALGLEDEPAITLHEQFHADRECGHDVHDWRFRPQVALAASLYSAEFAGTSTSPASAP
jgi:hypothetical protein